MDHPHHTLFILLALANAEKDDKYLTAGKKNTARLTRNNSKVEAKGFTEVSDVIWCFESSLEWTESLLTLSKFQEDLIKKTDPKENRKFCFPETDKVPRGSTGYTTQLNCRTNC